MGKLPHQIPQQRGLAASRWGHVDVEPVNFNRGFYTVDMRFFYNVTLQAYTSCPAPVTVEGLCVFDKRAILFGSEGSAKIFSSEIRSGEPDIPMLRRSNLPEAVVEAVDPIVLDARLVERLQDGTATATCVRCPRPSASASAGSFAAGRRRPPDLHYSGAVLHRASGRDTQLLVPVYDYCMPEKECSCGSTDDPCSLFRNINFPVGEFFPPNTVALPEDYEEAKNFCACCHK